MIPSTTLLKRSVELTVLAVLAVMVLIAWLRS